MPDRRSWRVCSTSLASRRRRSRRRGASRPCSSSSAIVSTSAELSYGKPKPRYVNRSAHEPIVDLALWQAAQHPNGRHVAPPRTGGYTLAGVLRCGSCGYAMNGTRTSRDRGSKRVYRCRRRHAGGICPAPAYVLADDIEAVVHGAFAEWLETLLEHRRPEGITLPGKPAPALDALGEALALAERRLEEALSPGMYAAAGEGWTRLVQECREARDAAALELGRARAELSEDEITLSVRQAISLAVLADHGGAKRELIARWLPVIVVRRGLPHVSIFPATSKQLPDVPQRGKRRPDDGAPELCPITDAPDTLVYRLRG